MSPLFLIPLFAIVVMNCILLHLAIRVEHMEKRIEYLEQRAGKESDEQTKENDNG